MTSINHIIDNGFSGRARYNLDNVPNTFFDGAYKENPTSFTYLLEGNQWIDIYPLPSSDLTRANFEPGAVLQQPWGKRIAGTELPVVMPHPALNDYINSVFARLDALIELDFYERRDWADGRGGLYRAGNYSQDFSGRNDLNRVDLSIVQSPSLPDSLLGISLANDGYSYDWDQRLTQYDEITNFWTSTGNAILDAYIILHELGHALGLEHPHDTGLDPNDGSLAHANVEDSSWRETIMSYNVDPSIVYDWDFFFRPLDIEALVRIWGPETGAANAGFIGGHEGFFQRVAPSADSFAVLDGFFGSQVPI